MDLLRIRHAGRLTMFAFWLTFLLFSVVIDYMKFQKSVVLTQATYNIVHAFDVGLISNIDAGKFGWIIATLIIIVILFLFRETLLSKQPTTAIIACIFIMLIFSHIIVMLILEQIWKRRGMKPNFILVGVYTIVWLLWSLHETYQLISILYAMDDGAFPLSAVVTTS